MTTAEEREEWRRVYAATALHALLMKDDPTLPGAVGVAELAADVATELVDALERPPASSSLEELEKLMAAAAPQNGTST